MDFEQWMTVVGIGAAPVGIVLGWGLKQVGDTLQIKATAKDRTEQEKATRSIRLLAAATTVESEGRNLAHAAYMKGGGRPMDKGQVIASMDTCNLAMRDLDRLILEADVFGPEGLADIGRTLQECGRDLVGMVHDMQVRLTNNDVVKVQEETLPTFQATLTKATKDVRTLLGKDS